MAEPSPEIYDQEQEDTHYDPEPFLKSVPTGGVRSGGDHVARGKLRGVPEPSKKELTPEEVNASEEAAGKIIPFPKSSEAEALGNANQAAEQPGKIIPFRNEPQKKRFKGKARVPKKSRKKLFLFLGIGGGASVIGIIAVAFFLYGLLKIPQFAQHITEYEFGRVTREFANNADQVTAEKVAYDSANAGLKDSIKATYLNIRGATWGKFDVYRPQKIIDKLQTNGRLKYNYDSGGKLTGVTFDEVTHPIDNGGFLGKFHPIDNFGKDVNLARDFSTALNDGLREETPLLIRGAVENNIRKELGISLFAWLVGRYQGKSQAEADLQMQQDTFTRADDQSAVGASKNAQLDQAERDGAATQQECVKDPVCLKKTLDSGIVEPQVVVDKIEKDLSDGFLKKAASFANPIVAVGLPVCMIYAGSLENSGPTIDTQNKEQQRIYFLVASGSDQQKSGATKSEAVGAMNWKLGNIQNSNPEIRSGGGTVDTTTMPSPQASAGGQFTVFDTFMGPFRGFADKVASIACPIITSPTGFVTLALVGLFAGVASGGSDQGISDILSSVVSGLKQKFTTIAGLKDFAKTTIRDSTLIVAGTLLAKYVVINNMGATNDGLATGTNFANTADAGGNQNAQALMQNQFYGAPMSNVQTAMNDISDQQYRVAQIKSQSTYQRYFAISNADSLISKFSTIIHGNVNGSVFSSMFSMINKVFNPLALVPKIFSTLNSTAVMAAGTIDNQHYGIVQWGWTSDEQNLINSNSSYQPLENAKIFTTLSGNTGDLENKLQDRYGICFTASMGTLLSSQKYIVRKSNGDVDPNFGLCSESQLGPSNNSYGPQAVFRWRLMQSYNATIDQLTQVQNAGGGA